MNPLDVLDIIDSALSRPTLEQSRQAEIKALGVNPDAFKSLGAMDSGDYGQMIQELERRRPLDDKEEQEWQEIKGSHQGDRTWRRMQELAARRNQSRNQ